MPIKHRTSAARARELEKRDRDIERRYDVRNGNPQPCPTERVPLNDEEFSFRHSGWSARREKILEAMTAAGTGRVQLERFQTCGSQAHVFYSPSEDKHVVRASYCRCRHCVPCANAKARLMAGNIRRRLKERPRGRYRFITLPIKHSTAPLVDQVDRLFKAFAKLRKQPVFRTQRGGCWVMECKIGDDGLWHPHLHLITEGDFLPQRELSEQWQKVTGDSFVVDVRQVRNERDVGHELTKYIAKGTSSDVWDDPQLAIEWVCAVRGRRFCGTFGSWRKFKLTEKPPQPDDLVHVAPLYEVWRSAQLNLPWAVRIMDELSPGEFTGDTS